jgi:probable rRNA maturation factor
MLEVMVADAKGRRLAMSGLSEWLQRAAPSRLRGAITIAIVSDARVRALNRRYRRVDRATDVLSFPTHTFPPERLAPARRTARAPLAISSSARSPADRFLGDIVIAKGVARRQARDAGHSELTELKVLALHGLLHLLGYDHERDDGLMRQIEQRLRRKGGLRQSLIERATATSGEGGT